jgi:membrane protein YdbS with pleckstrin-like domain
MIAGDGVLGWLADPKAAGGEKPFSLSPRSSIRWLWQGVALGAGIGIPLATFAGSRSIWSLVAAGILLVFVVPISVTAHHRLHSRNFRALASGVGLLVVRGVWWRRESFVPRARIQHIEIARGPLDRRLGTATLKVFTAGAETGEISIADLAHDDAAEMRARLLGADAPVR